MSLVLDSSVLAKLFFKEEGSEEATELLEFCAEESVSLAALELALYEVGNVIWKKLRNKEIDGRKYMKQLRLLSIDFVSLDEELMLKAMETAQKHGVTYYDGGHVALAEMRRAPLVTEDRELLKIFDFSVGIEQAREMVRNHKN